MTGKIQTVFNIIGLVNRKIGNGVSFLLLLIMILVGIATVSRYFFNSPITIVWPLIKQIFGVFVLIGGSYALLNKKHIKVEILYEVFPTWMKKVTWLISLICFLSFMGVLIWQGIVMADMSLMLREVSPHSTNIPIYPFKILLPICVFLFFLQGLVYYFHKK
jgi:TRAP-type mannitol/chloroaromatic compound transport system permease small subunit